MGDKTTMQSVVKLLSSLIITAAMKHGGLAHVAFDFFQLSLDRVTIILDHQSLVDKLSQRTDHGRPLELPRWTASRQRPFNVRLTSRITNINNCPLVKLIDHSNSQIARCSRRRQNSPPVPPPGELDETYASSQIRPIRSIM